MSNDKYPRRKEAPDAPPTESNPLLGPVVFLPVLGVLAVAAGLLIAMF